MTFGLLYAILLLGWIFWGWPREGVTRNPLPGNLLLFVLFLLLGWKVFGPLIRP